MEEVGRIERNFKYYIPDTVRIEKYMRIRKEAKSLALSLDVLCPASREKSLALTKLEETVMWANAAIARNE
jgi:hypothetical protein